MMRVAQIIDTLSAGGAERMAVGFANGLADGDSCSALIASRTGGALQKDLHADVPYYCAERSSTLDPGAVLRTSRFIRKHRISILHAHGTSFFFAVLLKCLNPSLRIIYHEHFGGRADRKTPLALKWLSVFFATVIVVNDDLKCWAEQNLFCAKVYFLPNYAELTAGDATEPTVLYGEAGKRIVLLANLKDPKNHIVALQAFARVVSDFPDWTLHLVGKDFKDAYSRRLKDFVSDNKLEDKVYFYGQREDVQYILAQASIGMLSSSTEGFPVTLLEYGLAGLPVMSSNAGYCNTLIEDGISGLTFNPMNSGDCFDAMKLMISDQRLRRQYALILHEKIVMQYSKPQVLEQLQQIYAAALNGK
jgi:glycosyltransferase involved in cell wall biosynthesis